MGAGACESSEVTHLLSKSHCPGPAELDGTPRVSVQRGVPCPTELPSTPDSCSSRLERTPRGANPSTDLNLGAKRAVEVTFAGSEAVAAWWGALRRPSLHFLALHSCIGGLRSPIQPAIQSARVCRGSGKGWGRSGLCGLGRRDSHPLRPFPLTPLVPNPAPTEHGWGAIWWPEVTPLDAFLP